MALNLGRIRNTLFAQSKLDDVGVGQKRTHETFYWSCSGNKFKGTSVDIDDTFSEFDKGDLLISNTPASDDAVMASVELPHGAIIVEVVVYGSDISQLYDLKRGEINSTTAASILPDWENINTATTTIPSPIVNNAEYRYFLVATGTTGDRIYGARITYQY